MKAKLDIKKDIEDLEQMKIIEEQKKLVEMRMKNRRELLKNNFMDKDNQKPNFVESNQRNF